MRSLCLLLQQSKQSERQSDDGQRTDLIESPASLGKGELGVAANDTHTHTQHGDHHGCTLNEAYKVPP